MLKRIAFFVYGSLSYLIFLGTFLYAIGFIGSFGVPRTLDGAPSEPLSVEERDLISEHGEAYESYRRSVPMFIPFTRRHRNSELAERISMRAQ